MYLQTHNTIIFKFDLYSIDRTLLYNLYATFNNKLKLISK